MSRLLHRSVNEPLWVDLHARHASLVPDQVYAWLRDPASLTRRVTDACPGKFRVEVKFQGWAGALNSETRLLRLGLREACLVREVELLCDEEPQVFARTLMPVSSLRGAARQLAHLRDKPLGKVLFANPHTRRKTVQIARIQPQHRLFDSAVSHLEERPEELWGRRTLFLYVGKPILVNEIFLPTLVDRAPLPVRKSCVTDR
ncbi:chorismate--pyruvate lyase family protein [Thiolapillus sp.]